MSYSEIRIGKKCNQNCLFCNSSKHIEEYYPQKEDVINRISEMARDMVRLLSISGGEPTVFRNLPLFISHGKKSGISQIELQTNGLMFSYKEYTGEIKDSGLDSALVSLHGTNEKTFNALTRTRGGFPLVLSGIRNLLERHIRVTLNFVINTLNYTELPDFVELINMEFSNNCKIIFSYIAPTGNAEDNTVIIPQITDVLPYLKSAFKKCVRYDINSSMPERCGIPLCVLRGFEKIHQSFHFMNSPVYNDKTKPEKCTVCKWDTICTGLWNIYVELYGIDEIIPCK